MRRDPRLTGRRGAGYAERFWRAVALAAMGSLWSTRDVAPWVMALCWAGVVVGALGAIYFGWCYVRSRSDPQ